MTPELAAASTDVAWRLTAFGTYRGEKSRALAALRRRVRSGTPEECEHALTAAIELVKSCEALLEEHPRPYLNQHKEYDFSSLHPYLKKHLAIFSEKEVDGVLSLVLLYYHLM